MELKEYRYTHDGETIVSLDPLKKWQVIELVRVRKEIAAADAVKKPENIR